MKVCHHCRNEVKLDTALQRTDGCRTCHSDLKVCLNCTFYDPHRNNQCREPAAEWCAEKSKANFCEFFQFADSGPGAEGKVKTQQSARAAFDALFRK